MLLSQNSVRKHTCPLEMFRHPGVSGITLLREETLILCVSACACGCDGFAKWVELLGVVEG